MSVALAFMHFSEYSGLMHFSGYSELMQALQCMQERKQSDCCRKSYLPEAEAQCVTGRCTLFVDPITRKEQEATSPEAIMLLSAFPL